MCIPGCACVERFETCLRLPPWGGGNRRPWGEGMLKPQIHNIGVHDLQFAGQQNDRGCKISNAHSLHVENRPTTNRTSVANTICAVPLIGKTNKKIEGWQCSDDFEGNFSKQSKISANFTKAPQIEPGNKHYVVPSLSTHTPHMCYMTGRHT